MEDLKERTVRSGFAKICGQGGNLVLRLCSVTVLARLLEPKDYGVVGMVVAVTGVFGLFKDAGLSSATIQSSTISDEQHSTLFWINILLGVILMLLLVVIAPAIVAFYHEPRLFWVTVALASGFLINAAGVQHSALLQRQMRFTTLTVIEILSQLTNISVGICMAICGFGYWSLVGMSISMTTFYTISVWLTTRWIPKMPRRKIGIRSMLCFGGTITLNGLVIYTAYNLDKVLLGRFWGADALGIYGRGQQVVNLPTENLNGAIGGVAFSALSRLQDDPERYKNYFLKGYTLLLSMTLPITFFFALYADDIIWVLLGPKWKDATIILRLMTPTILIFGMINPFGEMLKSIGLQVRSLKIALVIALLVITAYAMGLPFGPRGVAFAFSVAMVLWVVPHIMWCVHGTMISLRDILQAIRRPYLSAIVSAVVALGVQLFLGQLMSPFPRMVLGGGVLFGVYLWMLLFVMGQKTFYMDIFRALKGPSSESVRGSARA